MGHICWRYVKALFRYAWPSIQTNRQTNKPSNKHTYQNANFHKQQTQNRLKHVLVKMQILAKNKQTNHKTDIYQKANVGK